MTVFAVPNIDCEWDDWADWSACSVTCDDGTRTRNRAVKIQVSGKGTDCTGDADETETCTEQACSESYRKIVKS